MGSKKHKTSKNAVHRGFKNGQQERRKLVRNTVLGITAGPLAAKVIPGQWARPVVDSVALPVHAETTDPQPCTAPTPSCVFDSGATSTDCASFPCLNGATCIPVGTSGFCCVCAPGSFGTTCQTFLSPCDASPCLNGGTCMETNTVPNFYCCCPPGFTGDSCQTSL